jgi:hypothetical protein
MNGNSHQDSETRDCTLTGALIDATGQEIPITDDMIQQACEQLEDISLGKDDTPDLAS